jgi:hypothetical protein
VEMLSCAIEFVGRIPHVFTKYQNYVLEKLRKTTMLMKHLGGSGKRIMLSGYTGVISMAVACISLEGQPSKNKEIGDVQVVKLPVQPQVTWDLS